MGFSYERINLQSAKNLDKVDRPSYAMPSIDIYPRVGEALRRNIVTNRCGTEQRLKRLAEEGPPNQTNKFLYRV